MTQWDYLLKTSELSMQNNSVFSCPAPIVLPSFYDHCRWPAGKSRLGHWPGQARGREGGHHNRPWEGGLNTASRVRGTGQHALLDLKGLYLHHYCSYFYHIHLSERLHARSYKMYPYINLFTQTASWAVVLRSCKFHLSVCPSV